MNNRLLIFFPGASFSLLSLSFSPFSLSLLSASFCLSVSLCQSIFSLLQKGTTADKKEAQHLPNILTQPERLCFHVLYESPSWITFALKGCSVTGETTCCQMFTISSYNSPKVGQIVQCVYGSYSLLTASVSVSSCWPSSHSPNCDSRQKTQALPSHVHIAIWHLIACSLYISPMVLGDPIIFLLEKSDHPEIYLGIKICLIFGEDQASQLNSTYVVAFF